MRGFRRWLVLAALACLAGCASLVGLSQKPQVTLVGAQVLKFSLAEQRFVLRLQVKNPNEADLPIDRLDFDLELNGLPFAHGVSDQPVNIPAGGEGIIEVTATSDLASVSGLYRELKQRDRSERQRLDYFLRGELEAGRFGRVPFQRRGELDLKAGDFKLRPPGRS